MMRGRHLVPALLLCGAALCLPATDFAQSAFHVVHAAAGAPGSPVQPVDTAPPSLVAIVVDSQRILRESLAAQDVQKQLDQQREKFQTELSKDEARLRDGEQKLILQRDSISSEDFAKGQMHLREDVEAVDRKAQARRRALDIAFGDAMQTIRGVLLQIVQQAAAERHASVVLLRQEILWNDPSLDVTSNVLAQLNKKLPKLAVKISDNPDALGPDDSDVPTIKFEDGQ